MFLSSIELKNVRKHTDTRIEFADKLNYIVGGNGVGKSTILEAIYYLCTTKSCLTSVDAEVVSMGEKSFVINGQFNVPVIDTVKLNFLKEENKKVFLLNNKQLQKYSDLIGKFPVVMLSPPDHSITQGYPAERRKFVDSVISQTNKTYLELFMEYNRILRQRTFFLMRSKESGRFDSEEFDSWTKGMVKAGCELINHRKKFVIEFTGYMQQSYEMILNERENPGITYFYLDGNAPENIEEKFIELLQEKRADEIRRASNLVGPHRDDFIFEIDSINLKSYGSQGQHKTFQAVLRFAEYFYIKDKTGKSPLFLLDDVFGELDAERASAISNYLGTVGQAFITLTDFGNFTYLKTSNEDRIIRITKDSKITYA